MSFVCIPVGFRLDIFSICSARTAAIFAVDPPEMGGALVLLLAPKLSVARGLFMTNREHCLT